MVVLGEVECIPDFGTCFRTHARRGSYCRFLHIHRNKIVYIFVRRNQSTIFECNCGNRRGLLAVDRCLVLFQ